MVAVALAIAAGGPPQGVIKAAPAVRSRCLGQAARCCREAPDA
jgi:hypothetical protein